MVDTVKNAEEDTKRLLSIVERSLNTLVLETRKIPSPPKIDQRRSVGNEDCWSVVDPKKRKAFKLLLGKPQEVRTVPPVFVRKRSHSV